MELREVRVPVTGSVGGGLWFPALSAVLLAGGLALMAFAPDAREGRYTAWFTIALGAFGVLLGLHTRRRLAATRREFVLRAEDATLFDRHAIREVNVPYSALTEVKLYALNLGNGQGPPSLLLRWTVSGKSDQLVVDEAVVGEEGFDALVAGLEARSVPVNDQLSGAGR